MEKEITIDQLTVGQEKPNENDVIELSSIPENGTMAQREQSSQQEKKPRVVTLTANTRKPPTKGGAITYGTENTSKRVRVDPSTISMARENKKEPQVPRSMKMEQAAISDLEKAIERKTEEFQGAMEALEAKTEENRIAVAEGLDSVDKEVAYMPSQLHDERNPEIKNMTREEREAYDDKAFEEELERNLDEAETNAHATSNQNTRSQIRTASVGDIFNIDKKQEEQQNNMHTITPEEIEEMSGEDILNMDDNIMVTSGYITPVDEPDYVQEQPEVVPVDNVKKKEIEEKLEEKQEEKPVEEEKKAESTMEKIAPPVDKTPNSSIDDIFGNRVVLTKESPDTQINPANVQSISKNDFNIDDEDFADVDDMSEENLKKKQETDDDLTKQATERFRTEILEKIVNTGKKFDASAFKVSKKTVNIQQIMNRIKKEKPTVKKTATWALMIAGRPYISSALTGPEIVMLYTLNDNNSQFWANAQQMRILYNHDENPYKPSTFEAWAKTIPYADIDEVFAAAYIATFSGANYVPYSCENDACKNMELKDIDDIKGKMVKFKDDKSEKKFNKIYETPLSPSNSSEYETVVIPINDMISIGFRAPSIYNMLIELRSVPDTFITKYLSIITVMTYIDTIYYNNQDTGEFEEIEYKQYPGDVSKTFRSKIATYARVLGTLTTNDYNIVVAYINSLEQQENAITYWIPEAKCSKCGHTIQEYQMSGKNLVFLQQRLVNTATMLEG